MVATIYFVIVDKYYRSKKQTKRNKLEEKSDQKNWNYEKPMWKTQINDIFHLIFVTS